MIYTRNFDVLRNSLAENLAKFDLFKSGKKLKGRQQKLESFIKLISINVRGRNPLKNPLKCLFREVEQRPTRSFKEEKETQILKQLSSQLYYRFMSKNTDISEVQVLHVFNENRTRYLFFATNPLTQEKNFHVIKGEWEKYNLESLVTKEYQPHGVNEIEMMRRANRSKRHVGKLKQRVYSKAKADQFISFIQSNNGQGKMFSSQWDSLPNDGIYFVNPYKVIANKEYKVHAEEQLCYIVRLIMDNVSKGEWNFRIFGKKRPCSSCFGRLCYENEKNNDLFFSQYPGYLWFPALREQDIGVQLSTIRNFILKCSCESENRSGEFSTSQGTESQSSLESNSDEERSDDNSNPIVEQDEQSWNAYSITLINEEYNQSDSDSEMEVEIA